MGETQGAAGEITVTRLDDTEIIRINDRIEQAHIAECRWCRPGRMWACALIPPPAFDSEPQLFSPHIGEAFGG